MAGLFKEWVPRDLFGHPDAESGFHDDGERPRDLYGLLDGPCAYMAEGNPKGMGPDEPLDPLAAHGIGLARSRLESHS